MAAVWSAHAFGLTVRGSFAAPGLDDRRDPPGGRSVDVALADEDALRRRWPETGTIVCERSTADGGLVMRIDRDAGGAHRISAPGYGVFRISADGREILAAPGHPSPWRWQRYLIGQALPLAAVLQGIEPLHASAVVLDGSAVAFAGASLAGKTTLAMALVREGAALLCDDVLAVEPTDDGVLAHPGPSVANLRHGASAALAAPDGWVTELGSDEEARRVLVPAAGAAAPLRALYILDRAATHAVPSFAAPAGGAASLLLASSFNFIVVTPERLRRQLDVCARLAAGAEVAVLRLPEAASPAAVARAISQRLREGTPCAA